jgi:hypothetical protein
MADVWMTYRELADALGISPAAAQARARRNVRAGKWRHRIDNDALKTARVLVPPGDLDAMRKEAGGATQPPALGDTQGDTIPHDVSALQAELKASHEALAAQQERADKAEARADRAETERDAARGEATAERARAAQAEREREEARIGRAAAEGEVKGLREALDEACRPFWRRWIG